MRPPMDAAAGAQGSTSRGARLRGDDGAVLVEFAIIVPIFFLLIFGIMEFGWAFFQKIDVRGGANEGARLVAVNYKTTASPTPTDQATQIVNEVCARMGAKAGISVQVTRSGTAAVGQPFEVTISKNLDDLTGFFPWFDGKPIDESVRGRIEQTATWASMGAKQACP